MSPLQIVAVPEAAAVGRVLTVKPAGDDAIVWPNPSVTTTSYDPVSPATVGLIVRVSVVTPEIAPPLLRLAPSFRHRYVSVGCPSAVTANVAELPEQTSRGTGAETEIGIRSYAPMST